jgi:tetratricopeptide (TPR) repeat protein
MSDSQRERGATLLQEGRFTEAAQALREAVAINEADENAWRYLGAALGSSGDIPGSVAAFERTVALNPASSKNRYNLALAQERGGDTAAARASLEKALVLDPGYTQAREALSRLGVVATAPPTTPWATQSTPPVFTPPAPVYEPQPPGRTFLAIFLSFLAGAIGVAIWVAFVFFTNFNLALIGIGVGFLIGLGASIGYGREGKTPAIIAVIMAVIFVGGFSALNLLGGFLLGKRSGFGTAWSVIFNVLCTIWGIQQAYKTASSPVDSDD